MEIFMKRGDKVALVCCSNGQPLVYKETLQRLQDTLIHIGLVPVWSECIYRKDSIFSGSAQERADALMHFYKDREIKAIFDISGGDIANEILPYLDYQMIAESDKLFWGYSDLTTIINAIYVKTGKESVLYQVRNLIGEDADNQIRNFGNTMLHQGQDLFEFGYHFVQQCQVTEKSQCQGQVATNMKGVVVGGNIRCLLKLAGTEYFPDTSGKILLLEARGGEVPQMVTYLNQLKQMGVFQKVAGILLGTFTKMEKTGVQPSIQELVKRYAGTDIPIACTSWIGHGADAKAIIIGKELSLGESCL